MYNVSLFLISIIFSPLHVDQQEQEEDLSNNFDDLDCEIISAETRPEGHAHDRDHATNEDQQFRLFCRNSPCILVSQNLLSQLRARGQPRMANHVKKKEITKPIIRF